MKFSTLLKSNKLQGWEQFYLQYNTLIKYLKNDTSRFKSLLLTEFNKITKFFNSIEEQTDEQRNVLLKIISDNLTEETLQKKNYKDKLKHLELIEKIDKIGENKGVLHKEYNPEIKSVTKSNEIKNVLNQDICKESDVSIGGEESDFENIKIINEVESLKKKKKLLNFANFKLNTPFEKRKKEKAFHELLQAINSVKSFRDINYMGLSIAIRKYKNKFGNDEFSSNFLKKLHQSHFRKSKKIDKMQKEVRYVYKKVFVLDDKLQAQNIFKRIGKKVKPDPWLTFFVGILLTTLGIIILNADLNKNEKVKNVAYSIGFIQFGAFLFGLCDLLFIKYDINNNLIFNFDVISSLSPVDFILYMAITMNLTFLSCLFFSEKYPEALVYGLVGFPIGSIILPIDVLWLNSRLYFISVFIGTLFSGFRKVYFKNFFFADVFQSFMPCFQKLFFNLGIRQSYFTLIFFNNLFPFIRIIQCINRYKVTRSTFPHLINMSKYLLVAISLTINALYFFNQNDALWKCKFFFNICSSSFSLFWDFFLDWAIFRSKKLFPMYFYTLGSLYNFTMRYIWILNDFKILKDEYIFIFLEIVRRFVWAIFRIENEHVNNCTNDQSKMGLLFSKELFFIKDHAPVVDKNTGYITMENPEETL